MRENHSVELLIQALASSQTSKKRRKKPLPAEEETTVEEMTVEGYAAEEEEEEDPYEAPASFRYVSKEDYDTCGRVALHPSIRFDFTRFEQISRRAYPSAAARPADYYQHDPVVLFDALALATNLEAASRRAASQIAYERLVILENGDATRIIDRLCGDADMLSEVKRSAEEVLFALMAVENATRHPPPHLRPLLTEAK